MLLQGGSQLWELVLVLGVHYGLCRFRSVDGTATDGMEEGRSCAITTLRNTRNPGGRPKPTPVPTIETHPAEA